MDGVEFARLGGSAGEWVKFDAEEEYGKNGVAVGSQVRGLGWRGAML